MARMSIFNPNMAKLLPKFMKADETDVALSHAMDVLLAEPANRAKILRKWDQIDNMNDAQLDEMAWEFNIDWWDSSFSLETKRSVIRTCYRVHEKRGTKWAVEELITSAFGMGKVTEWFEYGGQPYWFKIQTSATLTKDGMLYFLNMIDKVKNARSHVEMIEVTRTVQRPLHGGTAHHSFSKCVVLDHFQETRKAEITQHGGTGRGSYHSRSSIWATLRWNTLRALCRMSARQQARAKAKREQSNILTTYNLWNFHWLPELHKQTTLKTL